MSSRDHAQTSGSALDTSGRVECAASFQPLGWAIWSDLDAFTRGYVEAMLRDFHRQTGSTPITEMGFSDLAPEALTAILKDCERQATVYTDRKPDALDGQIFWAGRRNHVGHRDGFPALTAYLGDDGKVRLRGSAKGVAASVDGQVPGRTK